MAPLHVSPNPLNIQHNVSYFPHCSDKLLDKSNLGRKEGGEGGREGEKGRKEEGRGRERERKEGIFQFVI